MHDNAATGALSIGAFEGSRWRLRRTRPAMGIESSFLLWATGVEQEGERRVRLRKTSGAAERRLLDCLKGIFAVLLRVASAVGTPPTRVPEQAWESTWNGD